MKKHINPIIVFFTIWFSVAVAVTKDDLVKALRWLFFHYDF